MDFAAINAVVDDNLTCRQVLEELCGLTVQSRGRYSLVLCPNHNDSNYGSCWVKEHGIHCFACGFHESTIGVLEKVKGVSYMQAIRLLKETYNLPIDIDSSEDVPKKTLRLSAEALGLIGINDTRKLKKLYEENRTLFWAFLDECTDYAARSIAVVEDSEMRHEVREALAHRSKNLSEFCAQLDSLRATNTPDTILLIQQKRTGGNRA